MEFITSSDLTNYINVTMLNMIIAGNQEKLNDAEREAKGFVVANLGKAYNLTVEFGKTAEARNISLVRWMVVMIVYTLFNQTQDNAIPERVGKNYDDVRSEIRKVASGGPTDLTQFIVDGKPKTKFRAGSEPRRSHFPY